jgi:hypothetical protein
MLESGEDDTTSESGRRQKVSVRFKDLNLWNRNRVSYSLKCSYFSEMKTD